MRLYFSIAFAILTIGCNINKSDYGKNFTNSRYYVSCPPHLIYCYRKSDLICRREYRVLAVKLEDTPTMLIECK